MGVTVAVAGASGYAGRRAAAPAGGPPRVRDRRGHRAPARRRRRRRRPPAPARPRPDGSARPTPTALAGADLVFLALPHGESAALAARAAGRGHGGRPRRRPPAARPGRVGAVLRRRRTPAPGRTACPSCPASASDRGRHRVAAPAATPSRSTLALAPLLAAGLVEPGRRRGRRRVRHLRRGPRAQAAPARPAR